MSEVPSILFRGYQRLISEVMPPSFSRVLFVWLAKFLLVAAGATFFILPDYRDELADAQEAAIPWTKAKIKVKLRPPNTSVESVLEPLPADDKGLRAWAEAHALGRVWVTREKIEDGVEVAVTMKFKESGLSEADEGEEDSIPWEELGYEGYKHQLRLGLTTSTSKTTWNDMERALPTRVWVWRGWLSASFGFLLFGALAWFRRRSSAPAVSRRRAILMGAAAGLVATGLGWAAGHAAPWGSYPQTTPWWVEFIEADERHTLIFYTLVGTLFVPFVHELFFRDLYARALAVGRGRTGAIISSAAGALFLMPIPLAALVMFVTGLGSCLLFKKTGRLLACITLSVVATAGGFALLWAEHADTPSWRTQVRQQLRQGIEKFGESLNKPEPSGAKDE